MTNKINPYAAKLKQSAIRAATSRCDELNGINLGQGVCDIAMHDAIKQNACDAINDNKNLYSDFRGIKPLRDALANKIKTFNQVEVNPDTQIMVTHGATAAYVTALKTLINPGDEIILFEPFYGYHKHVAEMFSAVIKPVTLNLENLSFNETELTNAISEKTKAIVVCTPNNPSGKVFSQAELELIGRLAEKHDFYIITDEMYEHFTYPGYQHISIASLGNFANRTITLSGFSKVYNMTGWRLGYAYGPAEIISQMGLIHDLLYICPVTPLQHASLAALQLPDSYYEQLQADFLVKRDYMVNALRELDFSLATPQGAYYILADASHNALGKMDSAAQHLLEEAKVASVAGEAFYLDNSKGKKQLRFCYALGQDKLTQAIEQMRKLLST